VKALLAALVLAAAVFGIAGAATLMLERRLVALAPGGVMVAALHYNPLSGQLRLADVRAHDAAGRELFRADHVVARVNPLRLLVRPLTLGRAHVTAPRLTLRAAAGFDLAELAAGLGAAPATATNLPVRVEALTVVGGSLVVEGAGERGEPLVVRELDLRLGRLTTAAIDQHDVAFAVEMTVDGTTVHLTGQPRGAGYAMRVRARGLDVARLARDLGVSTLTGLHRGRGEIDAELLMIEGRLLASGFARATDVTLTLPVAGRPRLRATALAVMLDHLDLVSGAGRVNRLDLAAPVLSLPAATAAPALAALLEPLRSRPALLVRRIAVTDGVLLLGGAGGVRLERLQLAARAPERHRDGAWSVSARAGLGAGSAMTLEGVVARDLRELDVVARLQRLAVAPWRALTGVPAGWDGRVSFDGRLRLAVQAGGTAITLAGRAVLADVDGAGRGGFRAERIALGMQPAGRALHDLEVRLAPAGPSGGAHLRLSASTEAGDRLGIDRIVPHDVSTGPRIPLGWLLVAIEEAGRTMPGIPSVMPAPTLSP
jgi:hypothetical protein